MKIFDRYVGFLLGGMFVFLPCFVSVVLAVEDSWQERACVNEKNLNCEKVSNSYKEPYCVTSVADSRSSSFECIKLSTINKFSPKGDKVKLSDFVMADILENYCSMLYSNSDEGRIYFAKPNGGTNGRDWQQTFDSHQSLFLYALCSSFKKRDKNGDLQMLFLKGHQIPIEKVFSGDLVKLLKLQQISENGKNLCSPDEDDSSTLNDCDMSIYATKIYEAIMSDLYKIKYAQVLDVDVFENFKVEEKVRDFMTGYNLSDKTYKELKNLYPKTLAILESNQKFYNKVLGTLKVIDNSMMVTRANKSKCPITGNMTGVDFVACALHSSQGNRFALTPSFVSLLYNEILHYRQFIMYNQLWLEARIKAKDGDVNILKSKLSDFGWYSQLQLESTKKVQHDFENFNMTYPLHIGLLMYTEKVEKFRNNSLSKIITSFYSLSEKLQNVQQPS